MHGLPSNQDFDQIVLTHMHTLTQTQNRFPGDLVWFPLSGFTRDTFLLPGYKYPEVKDVSWFHYISQAVTQKQTAGAATKGEAAGLLRPGQRGYFLCVLLFRSSHQNSVRESQAPSRTLVPQGLGWMARVEKALSFEACLNQGWWR